MACKALLLRSAVVFYRVSSLHARHVEIVAAFYYSAVVFRRVSWRHARHVDPFRPSTNTYTAVVFLAGFHGDMRGMWGRGPFWVHGPYR